MANVDKYAAGAFCWAELATTDAAGAKKFYTSLFGWTDTEHSMGEMGTYHMMKLGDRDAGAMYQMGPDMKGVPPHWITYVSVTNVDETVKKAESLGGKSMMPAMDVFSYGRCAFLTDPTGAAFAVWQPRDHIGAGVRGGHAATCWNELITTDVAAAKKFYTSLFGWKLKESPEYNEITNSDAPYPQGGIMQMKPEMGPMPSHWSVYFQSDDLDATVERAKSLGANLVMGPMEIPNTGRFAVLSDPQGAFFCLYQGQH
jgi:predicted enzyme related to lactoylglutathione lyase